MAQPIENVVVMEIIRNDARLTLRTHANKVLTERKYAPDATVIFKDGKVTVDQDELKEEAVA